MGMVIPTHKMFDEIEDPLFCLAYGLLYAFESKNRDDIPNAELCEGVAQPLDPPQWVSLVEDSDQRYDSIRVEDGSMNGSHLL